MLCMCSDTVTYIHCYNLRTCTQQGDFSKTNETNGANNCLGKTKLIAISHLLVLEKIKNEMLIEEVDVFEY